MDIVKGHNSNGCGCGCHYLEVDGRRVAEIVVAPTRLEGGVAVEYCIDVIPVQGGTLEQVAAFGAFEHDGRRLLSGRSEIDLSDVGDDPFFGCVVVGLPR